MTAKKKILHITSPGYRTAGRMVYDIHKEFLIRNYDSFVISKLNTVKFESTYSFHSEFLNLCLRIRNKFIRIYRKFFPQRYRNIDGFSFLDIKEERSQFRYRNILKKIPFKPDVVVIYALQEFLNARTINKIYKKTGAKIYWLLYDIAPITGGCHYSWDCKKYIKNCGSCPQLMSDDPDDITRKNWNFKNRYLSSIDICYIPCSEWLNRKALESSLVKGKQISEWMVPMDRSFKYLDIKEAKRKLKLSATKKYILFGAVKATDKRKGLEYLIEAFKIIKAEDLMPDNCEILVLGKNEDLDISDIPYNITNVGFVKERDVLINYYQAAYLVVTPSIEDAGPLMISEAIACGTPVVAFEMGTAFDLIYNGLTGYRAKLKDSKDLANGITQILSLNEEEYSEMSGNCIKIADDKLNMNKQIDKLIEILEINT